MIMILEGIFTMNTTVNNKLIISIICIDIKIVNFGVMENSPVNIVSMHIKMFMRLNSLMVEYSIKPFIVYLFIGIKYTGIPVHI